MQLLLLILVSLLAACTVAEINNAGENYPEPFGECPELENYPGILYDSIYVTDTLFVLDSVFVTDTIFQTDTIIQYVRIR